MTFSADSAFDESLPAEFGGYRVVRMLARSDRAITALVHGSGEARVARVFSTSCAISVIDAEVAVHDAIAGADEALRRHVIALDDLVSLDDGRLALLFEQVAGLPLRTVLNGHARRLPLGQAVTILAPLAGAIDSAHAAGLTGLSLDPAAVRFSAAGAPVIVRVQDAVAGPVLPERFRALEPAYAHDSLALQRLGTDVAASVEESERVALVSALRTAAHGARFVTALFDLAPPIPVRMIDHADAEVDDAAGPRDRESGHPVPAASLAAVALEGGAPSAGAVLPTWLMTALDTLRVLGLPETVVDPVRASTTRFVASIAEVRARTAAAIRSRSVIVRPRFAIAGAGGAAALIVAVTLISLTGSNADGAPPEPPAAHETAGPVPSISEVAAPGSLSAPDTIIDPDPEQWQEVVEVLIDRWIECRNAAGDGDSASSCEQHVVHAGSAAAQFFSSDDRRHAALERWSNEGGAAVVVERMGGAALIDLVAGATTTASLLLVRSEAGWRVRDVLDEGSSGL